MPFQPVLAYGQPGKGPSNAGKKGKPIMLADAIVTDNHEVQSSEHQSDVGVGVSVGYHIPDPAGMRAEGYGADSWITAEEWAPQHRKNHIDTYLLSDAPKATFNRTFPCVVPSPPARNRQRRKPEFQALVGIGGSYSVSGFPWGKYGAALL